MTHTKEAIKTAWFSDRTKSLCKMTHKGKTILHLKFQDDHVDKVGVNGVCMLDLIDAMIQRLDQFEIRWPRLENRMAIVRLKETAHWLIEKRENRKQGL